MHALRRGALCLMFALVARTEAALRLPSLQRLRRPAVAQQSVQVFDQVFDRSTLEQACKAGLERGHHFSSVFDRRRNKRGRTVLETVIASLLDECGDTSRYVEYWWRGTWSEVGLHRDVDETLNKRVARRGVAHPDGRRTIFGVQRCPNFGHVLYLNVSEGVAGPTCVFEEAGEEECDVERSDCTDLGGRPIALRQLVVCPPVCGRLLRFRGDMLHAVPGARDQYLAHEPEERGLNIAAEEEKEDLLRSVLIFNTWDEAPLLPSPTDPPSPRSVEMLRKLPSRPRCLPQRQWSEPTFVFWDKPDEDELEHETARSTDASSGYSTSMTIPLMGDERRRGTELDVVKACGDRDALRVAFAAARQVHSVGLTSAAPGANGNDVRESVNPESRALIEPSSLEVLDLQDLDDDWFSNAEGDVEVAVAACDHA